MKINFTLLLFLLVSFIKADPNMDFYGEDPEECKQKISIMTAYYKQKAYKEAAPSWRTVLKICPQSTKNIYIIGNKIMEDFISKATIPALKEKYIDTLLMLHDMRIQYFPENRVNNLKAKKAQDIIKYRSKTGLLEANKILHDAVINGATELDPSDFEYYLYSCKLMVQSNKLSCAELLSAYLKVTEILNKREKDSATDLSVSKQKIMDYSSACLNCNTLDSIYLAGFETNKNDTSWLDTGIDLLSEKKCNSSKALLMLLERRFTTKPVAKTASVLGAYYFSLQKKDKAEIYFGKAIELEKDDSKMGGHYINKAKLHISTGQYSTAKSLAVKAMNSKGNNSFDAYMIMGDAVAYSSSSCSSLAFGGKEVFWVAVDYYNKALANAKDAEDRSAAQKRIAKYSGYFPEKGELFLKSLVDGNSYRVECWINESTTVRSK